MDAPAWLTQRWSIARHYAGRHVPDIAMRIGLDQPIVVVVADRRLGFTTEKAHEGGDHFASPLVLAGRAHFERVSTFYETQEHRRPVVLRIVQGEAQRVVVRRDLP